MDLSVNQVSPVRIPLSLMDSTCVLPSGWKEKQETESVITEEVRNHTEQP